MHHCQTSSVRSSSDHFDHVSTTASLRSPPPSTPLSSLSMTRHLNGVWTRSACFQLKFKRLVFEGKRLVSKPGFWLAWGGGNKLHLGRRFVSGEKTNVLGGWSNVSFRVPKQRLRPRKKLFPKKKRKVCGGGCRIIGKLKFQN